MQENHLLEYIEIKDFKCFKDFRAEGFKRVNLIGGMNNVGKTAFMEACWVNLHSKSVKTLINSLCGIKLMRETLNLLENIVSKKEKLNLLKDLKFSLEISSKVNTKSNLYKNLFLIKDENGIKEYYFNLNGKDIKVNINDFSFEVEAIKNTNFIDNYGTPNNQVIHAYSYIQKLDKEVFLNKILKEFDEDIEAFKVIDEKAQCKKYGNYYEITELGDGTGNLISIVSMLFQSKNGYLFLDEIENGFHYTFLDRLWEIILTISKEQNVQVFATTHSKECIESYARVSKKLEKENKIEQNDISFIKMSKLKDGSINAGVRDYEMLQYSIDDEHEVR